MTPQEKLHELAEFGGARRTEGLSADVVERFVASDPLLAQAIDEAHAAHHRLRGEWEAALRGDEQDLIAAVQDGLLNFYPAESISPYVPLGARGPWVVTSHGAVVHDSGGYGMLGLGHAPQAVLDAMSPPAVMANVMTPNFSQRRVVDRLRAAIGKQGDCPYARFVFLNSGSESVTFCARISDANAARQTAPGAKHHGKPIKLMSLEGGFHGRTGRPAQLSDSTLAKYKANLASFRDQDTLITVPPNDVDALRAAFAKAEADGVFVEAMFMEPVMGEGNPGLSITRAFYDAARELTLAHGGLLQVDSIQAGLRAHGSLSIVDYPGFEGCQPPDLETFSKALNAGQYPMSVVGLNQCAAELYPRGVYGNTMTTNPRALEVACAVLDTFSDELAANVRERGAELLAKLDGLKGEFGEAVVSTQGTGLLLSMELDPKIPAFGPGGVEEFCRRHGVNIIHGGTNALRFTPHFAITSSEIDLIVSVIQQALRTFCAAPTS